MQLIHLQCKLRLHPTTNLSHQLAACWVPLKSSQVKIAMWFANTDNFCHRANCDNVRRDMAPHYRVPHQSTIAYRNCRQQTGLRTTRNTACSSAQRDLQSEDIEFLLTSIYDPNMCAYRAITVVLMCKKLLSLHLLTTKYLAKCRCSARTGCRFG